MEAHQKAVHLSKSWLSSEESWICKRSWCGLHRQPTLHGCRIVAYNGRLATNMHRDNAKCDSRKEILQAQTSSSQLLYFHSLSRVLFMTCALSVAVSILLLPNFSSKRICILDIASPEDSAKGFGRGKSCSTFSNSLSLPEASLILLVYNFSTSRHGRNDRERP